MPETVKREYTAQSKKPDVAKLGVAPVKGSGKKVWANAGTTRGNKTGKFEQGVKGQTKLPNLKRRK